MENLICPGIAFLVFAVPAFIFWAVQLADLMRRKDDDFPGQHDKVLWAIIIFFGALLGAVIYWFAKPRHRTSRAAAKSRAAEKYALDERKIQFPTASEDASGAPPDDNAT